MKKKQQRKSNPLFTFDEAVNMLRAEFPMTSNYMPQPMRFLFHVDEASVSVSQQPLKHMTTGDFKIAVAYACCVEHLNPSNR